MSTVPLPPFSARNRREKNWIEEDFPASARNGLLHVLNEAVEKNYLQSWSPAAKELRRIARDTPVEYSTSFEGRKNARFDVESLLKQVDWDRVYDFCERLHSHLSQDISGWYDNDETITTTKRQAQEFYAAEVQRLFEEEDLGYEFCDGLVQRRGKRHTTAQIDKADKVLADQRLNSARMHFSKALRYFHDRKNTDHENTVKEAVCAVEAAAKELFPDAKANTLGDFVGWAINSKRSLLPKTIGQTFSGLYAFRNSGEGVAHGAASGGVVTAQLSEYILAMAASQIVFLADLAKNDEEPPF